MGWHHVRATSVLPVGLATTITHGGLDTGVYQRTVNDGRSRRSRLHGAVLAGGQSRRLGRDKAMVRFDPAGPTLLERAVALLLTSCAEVVVVGPCRRELALPGIRWIADAVDDAGPLAGILAAVEDAAPDPVFVLACDLPAVPVDVIAYLAATDTDADVIAPVTEGESRQQRHRVVQTTCAIYRASAAEPIRRALARGDHRTTAFHQEASVRLIELSNLPDVMSIGPEMFRSVNTPADEAWARAAIASSR